MSKNWMLFVRLKDNRLYFYNREGVISLMPAEYQQVWSVENTLDELQAVANNVRKKQFTINKDRYQVLCRVKWEEQYDHYKT